MKYTDEQDAEKPKGKSGPRPGEGEMTKEELQATVNEVLAGCVTFVDEQLSPERAKATDYYLGKKFGNEKEGRSQVVNTEVRDHINGAIPALMRVFFGPEQIVEFVPSAPGAEATADAATKSVRYVFSEDNPGFMQTVSVLKDGMIRKLGIFKYWWNDGDLVAHEDEDLTMEQVYALASDESVTLTKVVDNGDGKLTAHYQKQTPGRVVISTLPPEEFLYNPEARDEQSAMLLGHRTHKKRGELIAMGIDDDVIEEHGGIDMSLDENQEELARRGDHAAEDPMAGDANDDILYVEAYIKLDVDGEGLVLRKICTIGPTYHIVHNAPADFLPFALFCPDPEPHTMTGQSWADRTMDLQLVTSSLIRATLDSLALAIFPRTAYVEGQANVTDILNTEIGQPMRERQPGMIREFTHSFVGKEALPVLGFFREIAERRTGRNDGTSSLDIDALQSTTKGGVDAAVTASQEHVEMLARIFAEQTLKTLFKGIFRLLKKHQTQTRMVRVRDQWVEMSPAQWQDMDVAVRVALGSMLVEKKLAILDAIAQKQEQALQLLGPTNPLCGIPELRNTYARAVELSGFPDPSEFFKVVPANWQPEPAPQQPSPEMLVAQIEQQKLQLETGKAQVAQQQKEKELQLREMEIGVKAQLQREKNEQDRVLEEMRIEAEMQLKLRELELKYQTTITTAAVEGEVDQAKERARIEAEQAREHARLTLDDAKHQREMELARQKQEQEAHLKAADLQQKASEREAAKQEKTAEQSTRKAEAAKPVVVNVHLPKRGKTKVTRDENKQIVGFEESD